MTQANLLKRIAQKLSGYWDYGSADFFTTKDVKEADMLDALNDICFDAFVEYVKVNPEYYVTEATADNYAATGTISAISSTTLTAITAIFTSDMVDGIVYNSTRDSKEKISAYTSTTVVTLDNAPSDWEATDTIYVFTGVYTFEGDIDDIYGDPAWVGMMYNTTDDDFNKCNLYSDSQAFRTRRGRNKDTSFSEDDPIYNLIKVTVDDSPIQAVKVRPIPDTPVTKGVYIRYIQQLEVMADDDAVPNFPEMHHKFLSDGAISEICFGHLEDSEKGAIYKQKYDEGLARLLDSITSQDEVRSYPLQSRLNEFRNRTR